jgi:hypoxanthine phosphoribosyltransferase
MPVPPPRSEWEVLTWERFGAASRELAQMIADDGYRPDLVLAVARGGLFTAGALGYSLGVKNTFTINVEFYSGIDERLPMPIVLPPVPNLVDLEGARVLIADDVADTGHTLELVRSFCEGKVAEARTAVIYQKPRSVIDCHYVWKATDRWIDFPWSSLPVVTGAGDAHSDGAAGGLGASHEVPAGIDGRADQEVSAADARFDAAAERP